MKIQITPIDEVKAANGVWESYRGINLLIARWNDDYLLQALRKVTRKRRNRNIDIDDPKVQKELIAIMAKKVLIGWEPFEIEGHKIEYSEENAVNLLTNDPDCRDFVSDVSRDMDLFMKGDTETTVGE